MLLDFGYSEEDLLLSGQIVELKAFSMEDAVHKTARQVAYQGKVLAALPRLMNN